MPLALAGHIDYVQYSRSLRRRRGHESSSFFWKRKRKLNLRKLYNANMPSEIGSKRMLQIHHK
jgi:hypothetical protein